LEVGIALTGRAAATEHADFIAYAQGNCGLPLEIWYNGMDSRLDDFRKESTETGL